MKTKTSRNLNNDAHKKKENIYPKATWYLKYVDQNIKI